MSVTQLCLAACLAALLANTPTAALEAQIVYGENFESGSFPAGWQRSSVWEVSSVAVCAGTASARAIVDGTQTQELVMPIGGTSNGEDIDLSLRVRFADPSDPHSLAAPTGQHLLHASTDGGNTYFVLRAFGGFGFSNEPGCALLTEGIAATDPGDQIYLKITSEVPAGQSVYIYLDDLSVSQPITCAAPGSPTLADVSPGGAQIAFADNSGGSATSFHVEVGAPGFAPGTGEELASTTATAYTGPMSVGLPSANTSYHAYARVGCHGGVASEWSGPLSFATPVDCRAGAPLVCETATSISLAGGAGSIDATACSASSAGAEAVYQFSVPNDGIFALEVIDGSPVPIDYSYGLLDTDCGLTDMTCIASITEAGRYLFGPLDRHETYYLLADNPSAATTASQTFKLDCYAPVAPIVGCDDAVTLTVDGTMAPPVVEFFDTDGNALAKLSNNENLGPVTVTAHGAADVRYDATADSYYLSRNVAINVSNLPTSPVEVQVMVTHAEIQALIDADPDDDIAAVEDLRFGKVSGSGSCSSTLPTGAQGVSLTAVPFGDNWALTGAVSGFSEFFVVSEGSAVVPVTLTHVSAFAKTDHNVVAWRSAQELALAGYSVEASPASSAWTEVGYLPATAEEGQGASYTFEHRTVDPVTYYRLVSRDEDGSAGVSETYVVDRATAATEIIGLTAAPNPSAGSTTIAVAADLGDVEVTLFDATGRIVRYLLLDPAGGNAAVLDVGVLPKGVYVLSSRTPTATESLRLVVE